MSRRSSYQAPRGIQSFQDVVRELRRVQEALDRATAPSYVVGLQTRDFTPLAPSFTRVSPPPRGLATVLPAASELNQGDSIVFNVEHPEGNFFVFAAPGQTVNGASSNVFDAAGLVELFSNGVDSWNSLAQLPGTAGVPVSPKAVVTSPPGFAFPVDEDGPAWLIGPPGQTGAAGAPGATIPGFPALDEDAPFAIPPVPFQWQDALGAGNHSGPFSVFVDVGRFVNFGLDGPTASNPQIRCGDALFRIRGTNVVSIGAGTFATVFSASGTTVAADGGTLVLQTALANRVVIDGTGEWTTPAGALGNVLTHQGPGAPPLWVTPSASGAAAPQQPPGIPFPIDDDGPPWVAIPGPPGAAGATGGVGATGATGATLPGFALAVDSDEISVGSLSRPYSWAEVLAVGNRNGGITPTIDPSGLIQWNSATSTKSLKIGDLGLGEDFTIQAAAATSLGIVSSTSIDIRNGLSTCIVHVEDNGTQGVILTAPVGRTIEARAAAGFRIINAAGGGTGALLIKESAFTHPITVAAGDGEFWVSGDTPNLPRFTDDTNVDFQLQNALVAQSAATVVSALTTTLAVTPTYTAAASTLPAGATFRLFASAMYTRGATATGHTISCFFNVGTFPSVTTLTAPTVAGTYVVTIEAMLTVLTTGAAGTSMGWIRATIAGTTSLNEDVGANATASFVLATNAAIAMNGVVQMNAAVAATSITSVGGLIQRVK